MEAPSSIKLSSPLTSEFWEIEVLYEDEQLLAVNKPAGLLSSPDRCDLNRPNLMKLLHAGITEAKPWASARGLTYLMNAHRLEFETSGVMLLAKSKPVLVYLANLFGSEKPLKEYIALVQGSPAQDLFTVDAKLAPHPERPELVRVDSKDGKRAKTQFELVEKFSEWSLIKCRPLTDRTHQIRVHLRSVGLPIVADPLYGGRPLLLSRMKSDYRLKHGKTERPLISRLALHAEKLAVAHPVSNVMVNMTAPWPKDLTVAVKYLQRYAAAA